MTIADNDIIAEIRRQPEQGFRLLMRKYREPVYWHIRRLVVTHADAQDAAQEAFVRIFKSMASYRGNTSFAAWIYRIATNEALRLISRRHDSVSMEREGTNLLDQLPADNYINIADTEAENMQRAILALPPKQQVVFNMRFYDEMEYVDIADATDSSVAAVKTNYHWQKRRLKRQSSIRQNITIMDVKLNKRLPYSVPDGFFDVMEANVMAKIKADAGINVGGDKADTQMRDKQYRKTTKHTRTISLSILAMAASLLLLFTIFSQSTKTAQQTNGMESIDKAFSQLNTDDQAFLMEIYDDDMFLDDATAVY